MRFFIVRASFSYFIAAFSLLVSTTILAPATRCKFVL
jgi:hypothetical protein